MRRLLLIFDTVCDGNFGCLECHQGSHSHTAKEQKLEDTIRQTFDEGIADLNRIKDENENVCEAISLVVERFSQLKEAVEAKQKNLEDAQNAPDADAQV